MNAFAPNERVVPMVMAIVLVWIPSRFELDVIIDATPVACRFTFAGRIGRNDGTSLLKIKMNLVLEVN